MIKQIKQYGLYGLLVVTLALSYLTLKSEQSQSAIQDHHPKGEEHAGIEPPDFPSQEIKDNNKMTHSGLYTNLKKWRMENAIYSESNIDLFAANDWLNMQSQSYHSGVDRLAIEETSTAPAPQAPPLPFTYIGHIQENDSTKLIMLMQGNQLIQTTVGQVINQVWKIQSETESFIRFNYLPLNIQKTLSKKQSNASHASSQYDTFIEPE